MRTVLIADRSLTIRRVVEHALGGRAARVLGAADADELHRLARVEHPDIVLCDATLPGLELEELRASFARVPELSETPFVLLSSALDPLDEEDATRLGASGLILKPFEMASLSETIERALERGVVLPSRPSLPRADASEDEEQSEAQGIPEPPSFDSVWDESPGASTAADDEEIVLEDSEPLELRERDAAIRDEEEEPLGPLSPEEPAFDPKVSRAPLPGDEDFRLGAGGISGDYEPDLLEDRAAGETPESPSLDDLARLEPDLRVLIERIVREVAWEVVPDIVERIVRERGSGVLPDTSSGDRKP